MLHYVKRSAGLHLSDPNVWCGHFFATRCMYVIASAISLYIIFADDKMDPHYPLSHAGSNQPSDDGGRFLFLARYVPNVAKRSI